jgi:hypothetical protein
MTSSSPTASIDADQRFIRALAEFIDLLTPDASSLAASLSRPLNATQTRQCLHDLLEWTQDLPNDQVDQAEALLKARGAPSLRVTRARVWKRIPQILARGRIEDDSEYYLLIAVLGDTANALLTPEQRNQAETLVTIFGTSIPSTRSSWL